MGIEGTYHNTIKAVYDNPTVNTLFDGEKLKVFALRSGTRQGGPFSPLLFNMEVVQCRDGAFPSFVQPLLEFL